MSDEIKTAPNVAEPASDLGLFGPLSASWQIHGDPSGFVGGIRALLLQALSMRAMRAVTEFSDYRADPWGRLLRTSDFIMTTTYRSEVAAANAIAQVRRVHESISGFDPGSGQEYSASSPELLAFIHNCFVDSMLASYQVFVRPLPPEIQLKYLAEQAVIARALGAKMSAVILDPSRLAPAIEGFSDIGMSEGARRAYEDISNPSFPSLAVILGPLWRLVFAAALDLLPPFAQEFYQVGDFRPAAILRARTVASVAQVARLVLPSHPYLRSAKYQWYRQGTSSGHR